MTMLSADTVRENVQIYYTQAAETRSCCDSSGCCESGNGLYEVDLSHLPADISQFSFGCGDPITLAELQPGQTVLDLGSGGGLDCFVAARQVGDSGRVIGIDMTPVMLEKANRNKERLGLTNVEFRPGHIENMPVENDSVDVIISNCVINLSPDKPAVFREAFRVLRPGGKLALSDMVTQGHFTPQERADVSAWAGCVSGAEDVADYVAAIQAAGFTAVSVRDKMAPDIELAYSISLPGPARLFSARVTAIKAN